MRVRLIHWGEPKSKASTARPPPPLPQPSETPQRRAELLETLGYDVDLDRFEGPESLRAMRDEPPDAVLIDLGRLPSHGRDVALALRAQKATRGVPIVFVDGAAEKVAGVKALLPDATYASWSEIKRALASAIASPPKTPVVRQKLAGYSGTPLPKKLGLKGKVLLIDAPSSFEQTLGEVPDAEIRRSPPARAAAADVIVWFTSSRKALEQRMEKLGAAADGLWVAWPKKASGVETDLSETTVREAGLARGLVDYKVCAIDETWSGLKFARRKAAQARR